MRDELKTEGEVPGETTGRSPAAGTVSHEDRLSLGTPWHQDGKYPKHIYNCRDEIVALTFRESTARQVVEAVNAASFLEGEAASEAAVHAERSPAIRGPR